MAYIEVLVDGFTVASGVRRAGDLVNAPEFKTQSKAAQVERWGFPMYKEISQAEYEERGGGDPERTALPVAPSPAQPKADAAPAAAEQDEFADMVGLNVAAVLSKVATFDDEKTARFIAWERAGQARKGVLGPLGESV